VARPQAFLVDVFETILTCDFTVHARELPLLAGVPAPAWNQAFALLGQPLSEGRTSLREAFEQALRAVGATPLEGLADKLAERDQELLFECSRLCDDTVPFLNRARARGFKVALVSNCAANARPLLEQLGVVQLVDAVVLSCEVGRAKPSPGIYQRALEMLGVAAGEAVFVDDQPGFCAGAEALGIQAVRIERGGPGDHVGPVQGDARQVVGSLTELEEMFWTRRKMST
jgi:putative hydrolase of the HAD superfamily